MNPGLSIVVPIYNETENIKPLYEELVEVFNKVNLDWEVIFVDDGSKDDSLELLTGLAKQDDRVKVISFRRNFGQTAAMTAGFDHARGDVIVPMDGDLQNDPADIPKLLGKMDEGFDVVSGWRKDRQDKFIGRRLPSVIANRLISYMTGVSLHDYGCTLKAYRRDVLQSINLYGELHRFVPALASQAGGKVTEIAVNHRARIAGESKYGIDRTQRVILDLITVKFLLKYSTRPLQLFGKWSIFSFLASGATGLTCLYMKFFEGLSLNRNPLTVLTAFLLFAGVQFICLGLLGELMTRTYHEAQNKSIYAVRETCNLDAD